MIDIQPIETHYKGYKFRSRLEARWAVFFDLMGIKYEYEEQGYVLRGTPYLPDFYLPDLCCYVEIKRNGYFRFVEQNEKMEVIPNDPYDEKYRLASEIFTENGLLYIIFCGDPLDVVTESRGSAAYVFAKVLNVCDKYIYVTGLKFAGFTKDKKIDAYIYPGLVPIAYKCLTDCNDKYYDGWKIDHEYAARMAREEQFGSKHNILGKREITRE